MWPYQKNHRCVLNLKDSPEEITHKHSHLIVTALCNATASMAFIPVSIRVTENNSFSCLSDCADFLFRLWVNMASQAMIPIFILCWFKWSHLIQRRWESRPFSLLWSLQYSVFCSSYDAVLGSGTAPITVVQDTVNCFHLRYIRGDLVFSKNWITAK